MFTVMNTYLDDYFPHWHNRLEYVQYHILVIVTDGQLRYRLNDESLIAAKGDVLFIPAGTEREAINDGLHPHQKYAVVFTGEPDFPLALFIHHAPVFFHSRSFEWIKDRMVQLHRHSLEKKPYYEVIRLGILTELLGMISRELDSDIPQVPYRKAQYAKTMEQYLLQHYRDSVALGDLAALIGRSPNYALMVFKEVVGLTPLAYLHHLRISAAKDLLLHTNLPVRSIAEHLGYYDPSYFYRMFRKSTGVSPTQIRNRAGRGG